MIFKINTTLLYNALAKAGGEIAAPQIHQLAAGEIRRPAQLPQIPVTARLIAHALARKDFRIGGEVTAKNHGEGP